MKLILLQLRDPSRSESVQHLVLNDYDGVKANLQSPSAQIPSMNAIQAFGIWVGCFGFLSLSDAPSFVATGTDTVADGMTRSANGETLLLFISSILNQQFWAGHDAPFGRIVVQSLR